MTRPTVLADGPWAPLPAPTPGPQAQTLVVAISAGESACLTALAARWGWQPAHVAAYLLSAELACRFLDEQPQPIREVAP